MVIRRKRARRTKRVRAIRPRIGRIGLSNYRLINPFPSKFKCRFKYGVNEVITLTAGILQVTKFNMNGLFDPDRSGVGHQPYGFDQFTPMYNRYRVYKCKWYIDIVSNSNIGVTVAAVPVNTDTTFSNVNHIIESPRSRSVMSQIGVGPRILSGSISLPALTGQTMSQYQAGENYQSLVTTDPAEIMVLHVGYYVPSTAPLVYANVILTYTCELFDPKEVGQS